MHGQPRERDAISFNIVGEGLKLFLVVGCVRHNTFENYTSGGRNPFYFPSSRSFSGKPIMKILNVAEKNDSAKSIAALLSGNTARKRPGDSYTSLYEFEYEIFGQTARMVLTSVRGHLLNHYFPSCRNWNEVDPVTLFEAPVDKHIRNDCDKIKKTLEREIVHCPKLIIWTDCDREGENIGFEIIKICKAVRQDIEVYRATFSEITEQSVRRALNNLKKPNKDISNAVDVRSELDLRIGAAFTRFQTIYLRKAFPSVLSNHMVSYGTCQFPTLGFVVERFKAVSEFKPETFWHINVRHTIGNTSVDFCWKRHRLFDKLACEILYDKCVESGIAKVENVETKPKTKWRPQPLITSELQKMCSKKFRFTGKKTLDIAEALYCRGLISYPRTETNYFSSDIDLVSLVRCQTDDSRWGEFAQRLLNYGPDPFQGKKMDQAHPPIYPIKHSNVLKGDEKAVYEFITRHFLACLSKHAVGLETTVDIDVDEEKFRTSGLVIKEKNYLEVYPYETWEEKQIHTYQIGQTFTPEIFMEEGETSPPELLTEADLISLMEKHGIGTDATHAEHIETVKKRLYVGVQNKKYFVPRTLGMGLVEGYNTMGYPMARPEMRAELEEDLKRICGGQKSPREVLTTHIAKYKKLFEGIRSKAEELSKVVQSYIEVEATPVDNLFGEVPLIVGKCPTCHSDLHLKCTKTGKQFVGCSAYPVCKVSLWLPTFVLKVTRTADTCPRCGPDQYLLRFKLKEGTTYLPPDYVGCVGGCDWNLLELLNSKGSSSNSSCLTGGARSAGVTEISAVQENNDSGFFSLDEVPSARGRAPSDGAPPNCYCGVAAVFRVVRQQGPNLGREFYGCGLRSRENSGCGFFSWKTAWKSRAEVGPKATVDEGELPRCYCSLPCRRVTATKAGRNKGRDFFACGKAYGEVDKCDFFQWADGEENSVRIG